MNSEYGAPANAIRKRKRPALSCVECRRRKIRCDRSHPCSQCRTINSRCTFTQFHDLRSDVPQSQRVQTLGVSTNRPGAPAGGQTSQDVSQSPQPAEAASQNYLTLPPLKATGDFLSRQRRSDVQSEGYPNAMIPTHQRQLSPQERQSEAADLVQSSYGLSYMSTELLARQIGLRSPHIVLNKTRTLRWSHWMGSAAEVFSIHVSGKGSKSIHTAANNFVVQYIIFPLF